MDLDCTDDRRRHGQAYLNSARKLPFSSLFFRSNLVVKRLLLHETILYYRVRSLIVR
jgi:hypothetical protein